jgi:hypothetical protein
MKKLINNNSNWLKYITWIAIAAAAIITLPIMAYNHFVEGSYFWTVLDLCTTYLFVTDLKDNTYYKKYISKKLY